MTVTDAGRGRLGLGDERQSDFWLSSLRLLFRILICLDFFAVIVTSNIGPAAALAQNRQASL